MAVSFPTHSIGDRRRAPLVLALGALVTVVGLAATRIGLVITLVALRHDRYGYAAIGVASALATAISGVVAWRTARGRRTRFARALFIEAAMLISALAVTLSWAVFVLFALARIGHGLDHAFR